MPNLALGRGQMPRRALLQNRPNRLGVVNRHKNTAPQGRTTAILAIVTTGSLFDLSESGP
jgi:hypothetical protein